MWRKSTENGVEWTDTQLNSMQRYISQRWEAQSDSI